MKPNNQTRERARENLTKKVAGQRRILADPHAFSTVDPHYLIEDAEFRLRWIDCAPEGANHQVAPLQDKDGVPMGGNYNENVGPNEALRNARSKRGLNPFSGEKVTA